MSAVLAERPLSCGQNCNLNYVSNPQPEHVCCSASISPQLVMKLPQPPSSMKSPSISSIKSSPLWNSLSAQRTLLVFLAATAAASGATIKNPSNLKHPQPNGNTAHKFQPSSSPAHSTHRHGNKFRAQFCSEDVDGKREELNCQHTAVEDIRIESPAESPWRDRDFRTENNNVSPGSQEANICHNTKRKAALSVTNNGDHFSEGSAVEARNNEGRNFFNDIPDVDIKGREGYIYDPNENTEGGDGPLSRLTPDSSYLTTPAPFSSAQLLSSNVYSFSNNKIQSSISNSFSDNNYELPSSIKSNYINNKLPADSYTKPVSYNSYNYNDENSYNNNNDNKRNKDNSTVPILSVPLTKLNAVVISVILTFCLLGALNAFKLIIQSRRKCRCQLCRGEYKVLKKLGSGGYGVIYLAESRRPPAQSITNEIQKRKYQHVSKHAHQLSIERDVWHPSSPKQNGIKTEHKNTDLLTDRTDESQTGRYEDDEIINKPIPDTSQYPSATAMCHSRHPSHPLSSSSPPSSPSQYLHMKSSSSSLSPLSSSSSSSRYLVMKKILVEDITEAEGYSLEGKRLIALRHKHVVLYYDDFIHQEFEFGRSILSESATTFFIIMMEYCPKGDIKMRIERDWGSITERMIRSWLHQICLALQYIHEREIIHRDIKSANLFLSEDDSVRLGDLGLSRDILFRPKRSQPPPQPVKRNSAEVHPRKRQNNRNNSQADGLLNPAPLNSKPAEKGVSQAFVSQSCLSQAGTDCYMAPEIFSSDDYGKPCDVWSLGCVLLELCSGLFMWELEQQPIGLSCLSSSSLIPNLLKDIIPNGISPKLRRLLHLMLSIDPKSRPTVCDILRKKWLINCKDLSHLSLPLSELSPNNSSSSGSDPSLGAVCPKCPTTHSVSPRTGPLSRVIIDPVRNMNNPPKQKLSDEKNIDGMGGDERSMKGKSNSHHHHHHQSGTHSPWILLGEEVEGDMNKDNTEVGGGWKKEGNYLLKDKRNGRETEDFIKGWEVGRLKGFTHFLWAWWGKEEEDLVGMSGRQEDKAEGSRGCREEGRDKAERMEGEGKREFRYRTLNKGGKKGKKQKKKKDNNWVCIFACTCMSPIPILRL